MNLIKEGINLEELVKSDLPLEVKVNVLFDVLKNVLDEGAIRARTIRFKLQKYVNSSNINERIYALDVIASDGNGAKVVPSDEDLEKSLEDVVYWISENIAKKYVSIANIIALENSINGIIFNTVCIIDSSVMFGIEARFDTDSCITLICVDNCAFITEVNSSNILILNKYFDTK